MSRVLYVFKVLKPYYSIVTCSNESYKLVKISLCGQDYRVTPIDISIKNKGSPEPIQIKRDLFVTHGAYASDCEFKVSGNVRHFKNLSDDQFEEQKAPPALFRDSHSLCNYKDTFIYATGGVCGIGSGNVNGISTGQRLDLLKN